jgi:hypothetical protein
MRSNICGQYASLDLEETLPQDQLPDVVLPPISISTPELDALERIVIGLDHGLGTPALESRCRQ